MYHHIIISATLIVGLYPQRISRLNKRLVNLVKVFLFVFFFVCFFMIDQKE